MSWADDMDRAMEEHPEWFGMHIDEMGNPVGDAPEESTGMRDLPIGYVALAGIVSMVGTIAVLLLLVRSPGLVAILVILAVAAASGAVGATWLYRRINR